MFGSQLPIGATCTAENLTELKVRFEGTVSSKRRMNEITGLNDLITVLKKRDALDEEAIGFITNLCLIPVHASPQHQPQTNISAGVGFPLIHQAPLTKVYEEISDSMGREWREFARNLGMREGQIDQVSMDASLTCKQRIYKVLNYHEQRSDPASWRRHLLNALDKAGRSDLRVIVEKTMDRMSITRPTEET